MLGVVLARWDTISLPWFALLLAGLLVVGLLWRKSFVWLCVLGMVYGLSSLWLDVQRIEVDESWLNHKIQVTANIAEVRESARYTRLRLSHISRDDGQTLAGFADVYVYRNRFDFKPDMSVQLRTKFHLPHNKLNPATFDYATYCFEQHIAVLGSVYGEVQILEHDLSWLTQFRLSIRQAIQAVDEEAQGILLALLLADRSRIPLHIDDAFAASGAMHLLAISGLHVGLVAGWGFVLCWWLLTRREVWIVKLPVRVLALSFGVVLTLLYATLASWPIPAQRASLMLFAAVLAWYFRAKQVPLNTMLAALILIVLFDPASVLSVSLWLSFVATTSLLIWANASSQKPENLLQKAIFWCKAMFFVSLFAALATLPLIAAVFERLPVWSLLANTLLLPLYAFWVLPLALLGELCAVLGLTHAAEMVLHGSALAITWGNHILLLIYQLPAGHLWLRADMDIAHVCLALSLLLAGVLLLQQHQGAALALLFLTLLIYISVLSSERQVKQPMLHAWDVGQGASALLQTPGFKLLVDVPGKRGSKFNGGTIAAANARALGILTLDAVVLSHAQSDHAGGILRLLASLYHVQELWLADVPDNHQYPTIQTAIQYIQAQGGQVRWLQQGDVIALADGTKIDVLWPPQGYQPSNGNNTSLLLAVHLTTGQRLLFPGDMQRQVERKVTAKLQAFDVLLMPHHGSKTSSTKAFVQAVQPDIVIAQTGYRNHYGFPKAEVVARYVAVGSEVLNTAEGAVSLSFSRQGVTVEQFQAQDLTKRKVLQQWFEALP